MALTAADISKLFTTYIPGYSCVASKEPDASFTLQFTNLANLEVITLPGFSVHELATAPLIKRLSKVLFEEFVVVLANRPYISQGTTKH